MAYGTRTIKAEDAGAKDRGRKTGHYGPRHEAKEYSRKVRRLNDKRIVSGEVAFTEDWQRGA